MLQQKIAPQNKLHLLYAAAMLFASIVLYLVFIGADMQFNGTHGDGQQTLPGMDSVVTLVLAVVIVVLIVIQTWMLFRIKNKDHLSLLHFLLALPLMVFIPLGLSLMSLPKAYCYALFAGFFISNLAVCLAIRYRQVLLITISFLLLLIPFAVAAYLFAASSQDELWWDNGKQVKYTEDGKKILEIENKKKGIYYGNYTEWDEQGELIWFRRYPNGSLEAPDSAVAYVFGQVKEIQYSFDSAAHHYVRQTHYVINQDSAQSGFLFINSLVNMDTKDYCYREWYRDIKILWRYDYTFDSSGNRYLRQLQYKKDKSIYSSATRHYDPQYFQTSDNLY